MTRGMLFAMLLGVAFIGNAGAGDDHACTVTAADMLANAKLSFWNFDQTGTTASTARALANRGCYSEAAAATEDFMLLHAPLKNGERIILLFHEGQYRAMAGEERVAAMLIAASKDLGQKPSDSLDWNTYVEGTWAFLTKNHPMLDAASAKLLAERGRGNVTNARVLHGLQMCFGRSYKEAYSSKCFAH
jgi:hypothetical protein